MYRSIVMAALLAFSSLASAADIVVVTSANAGIDSLSRADVQQLFSGKKKEVAGIRIQPLDQPPSSKVRDEFYQKVLDKNPSQMRAYWARMTFTGKANPPGTVSGSSELGALLGGQAVFVGYLPSDQVSDGMKVLYRVQ
jgi:ABC-type phosphate transport system substrate-binding protein